MTPNPNSPEPAVPPLAELLAQYLQRQAGACGAGATSSEVVPFEAGPVQPVDARLAWQEALTVMCFFHPACPTPSWQAPVDWPALVQVHEPAAALAFSLGNYPQLVRNLQRLWQATDLAALRPAGARPVPGLTLADWVAGLVRKSDSPQILCAVGVLRLARHFEEAANLLEQQRAHVPAEWRAAWDNEEAALAWHRGHAEAAAQLWQSQPESIPVLFNRGMAALFLAQPAACRRWLSQAVAQLPQTSAWHHLGRLYLALAELRG